MSRHVQIGTTRIYRVIDSETGSVLFETLDPLEAEEIADQVEDGRR